MTRRQPEGGQRMRRSLVCRRREVTIQQPPEGTDWLDALRRAA